MKLKKLIKEDNSSAFWIIKEALEELDEWDYFLQFFGLIDEDEAPDCMELYDYDDYDILKEFESRGLRDTDDMSLTQELFLEEQKEKIRKGEVI